MRHHLHSITRVGVRSAYLTMYDMKRLREVQVPAAAVSTLATRAASIGLRNPSEPTIMRMVSIISWTQGRHLEQAPHPSELH